MQSMHIQFLIEEARSRIILITVSLTGIVIFTDHGAESTVLISLHLFRTTKAKMQRFTEKESQIDQPHRMYLRLIRLCCASS